MNFFGVILPSAISIATVLLFGCLGETIMEKAGHLNLGIPGVMCLGTYGGCLGVAIYMHGNYENPNFAALLIVALLFSAIFSSIGALIYALLTVTLRCNQNVTGLALTTFGGGFADYFMSQVDQSHFAVASKTLSSHLTFPDTWGGAFGRIFLGHSFLVYLAIILAIGTAIVLKYTKVGLSLRAVGENPGTADAAGINVTRYKYCAIVIGSIIAGFGGLFYVMNYVGGSWENSSTIQAFGWLAIALVIFTVWKPGLAILGSIIFGLLYILPNYVAGLSLVAKETFSLLPYVVTVLVLIVTSIIGKKGVQPPEALGLPYFREER